MRARVLVVDDDPALAEMLGIVLRSEGFAPAFVADGERALAAFREVRPDIVLLDLMLPGHERHRRLSGYPERVRRADRDVDGQNRHRRRRARPRVRRRRLRDQAVQAEGTRRPHAGAAAARRRRRARVAHHRPGRQPDHDRRAGPPGDPQQARRSSSRHSSSTCSSRSRASRVRCSRGRSCSSRSGVTGTPRTRDSSTCTCSGFVPRSRMILSVQRSS